MSQTMNDVKYVIAKAEQYAPYAQAGYKKFKAWRKGRKGKGIHTVRGRREGPLLPGGEYRVSGNMTAASRQFLGREGRRRRKGRPGGVGGMRQGTGSDAPVNFSNTNTVRDSDFVSTPVPTGTHGPGASVAFSAALTSIGSNGVTTVNVADYQNAIGIAGGNSIGATILPSGFVSADNNWATGILIHPNFLGARMQREAQNWTEWQPEFITFSIQNQVATTQAGTMTMSFTRDPDSFAEAAGTQATPTHSYSNLTQTVPNCSTNTYKDQSITINRWDRTKYFPCETATTTPFAYGQNVATLAYNSTHYCGRFICMYSGPAFNLTTGTLWVKGVFRFYGPQASQISIASNTTAGSLVSSMAGSWVEKPLIFHRGKWRNHNYVCKLLDHVSEKKQPLYDELIFRDDLLESDSKSALPDIEDLHDTLALLRVSKPSSSSSSLSSLSSSSSSSISYEAPLPKPKIGFWTVV